MNDIENLRHHLFSENITDLLYNEQCILCRPGVQNEDARLHNRKHCAKVAVVCEYTLRGCRLQTHHCIVDKAKPSRYHFHCPICLMGCKDLSRISKHIECCMRKATELDKEVSNLKTTTKDSNFDAQSTTKINTKPKHLSSSSASCSNALGTDKESVTVQADEAPVTNTSSVNSAPANKDGSGTSESAVSKMEQCPICSKMFASSYIARHRAVHMSDKKRPCMLVDPRTKYFLQEKARVVRETPFTSNIQLNQVISKQSVTIISVVMLWL